MKLDAKLRGALQELFDVVDASYTELLEAPETEFREAMEAKNTVGAAEWLIGRRQAELAGDTAMVAFMDGAGAAMARDLSVGQQIVCGIAHLVADMGSPEDLFWGKMAPAFPGPKSEWYVKEASKNLKSEQLWPWNSKGVPVGSKAPEIAKEAGW